MKKKILNLAFYAMFIFYIFLMLDIFFRINVISSSSMTVRRYNLIPFQSIMDYISGNFRVSNAVIRNNVLGNIAVFIPYGLYLQVLLKNKGFGKSLLILALTSVFIEIIQFVFCIGAADIDDVILNVCGGILSIFIYKGLRKLFHDDARTKTAITILSLVVGVPVMLVYLMITIRRHL